MWTPVEIYNLDYTHPNDQSLWKKIMQNLGGEFLLWCNSPEDGYELDLNLELL